MGFFKSFFSGKSDSPANEKQKNEQKNFEIFKYDGMRAQRMGRTDYAIKCFTEALAIQEDFETMGYLAQVYTQTNELDEAHKLLERMTEIEPEHTSTYLSLANVCYMQEDYPAMAGAAKKAIEIEEGNAMAHYLLGKADNGQGDGIMCIAHLTKAIVLKDDFIEARLLRAEALVQMQQYKEAMEDIDTILAQDPCHLAPRKDRRSYGKQRKSRKQLSESDGVESLQRTSLPLLRTALHHPKQAGRSHRALYGSHRTEP